MSVITGELLSEDIDSLGSEPYALDPALITEEQMEAAPLLGELTTQACFATELHQTETVDLAEYKKLVHSVAYHFACKTGTLDRLEDLEQECLIKAWLMTAAGTRPPIPYLCRAMVNGMIDHLRSTRRSQEASMLSLDHLVEPDGDSTLSDVTKDPHELGVPGCDPIPREELAALITAAINSDTTRRSHFKKERCITIALQRILFNRPAQELAEELGVSESGVSKIMEQARVSLKKRFDQDPEFRDTILSLAAEN